MSVGDLKYVLRLHGVPSEGYIEKSELVDAQCGSASVIVISSALPNRKRTIYRDSDGFWNTHYNRYFPPFSGIFCIGHLCNLTRFCGAILQLVRK